MKRYFESDEQNRAALILASMSPDLVNSIIDLASSQGSGLTSRLFATDDGPPRPLAMFSNAFVTASDFPHVWLGFLTTQIAALRRVDVSAEEYSKMLVTAFGIPSELAAPLAKQIETYDVIGSSYKNSGQGIAWYKSLGSKIQETIRRVANTPSGLFNLNGFLYNDQSQQGDIDYLYELAIFGKVVDDLMMRGRLMRGQASINQSLGYFQTGDPLDYGDAEATVYETFQPAMGAPLPAMIFGGAKKLAEAGSRANLDKIKNFLLKVGLLTDDSMPVAVTRPDLKNATLDVIESKPTVLSDFDTPPTVQAVRRKRKNSSNGEQNQIDATYSTIAEEWGEPMAQAWMTGNPYAMLAAAARGAQEYVPSTGDPEADRAIMSDVNRRMAADQMGDPAGYAADAETGFLFFGNKKKKKLKKAREEYLNNLESQLQQRKEEAELRQRYEPATTLAAQGSAGLPPGPGFDSYAQYGPQAMAAQPGGPAYPYPPFNPPFPSPSVNFNSVPATAANQLPSYGYTGMAGGYGSSMLDFFQPTPDASGMPFYPML